MGDVGPLVVPPLPWELRFRSVGSALMAIGCPVLGHSPQAPLFIMTPQGTILHSERGQLFWIGSEEIGVDSGQN